MSVTYELTVDHTYEAGYKVFMPIDRLFDPDEIACMSKNLGPMMIDDSFPPVVFDQTPFKIVGTTCHTTHTYVRSHNGVLINKILRSFLIEFANDTDAVFFKMLNDDVSITPYS
jgi:hypothetical protein